MTNTAVLITIAATVLVVVTVWVYERLLEQARAERDRALDERDAARDHADDAQHYMDIVLDRVRAEGRSNVRVLRVIP